MGYEYRRGSDKFGSKRVVGTGSQFVWPAKGAVTIKQVGKFDAETTFVLKGVDLKGSRSVEFLTLKGSGSAKTTKEYLFVESLSTKNERPTSLPVTVYDVNNQELLKVRAGSVGSRVPWVYSPSSAIVSVVGFGASTEPLTSNSVTVQLVVYHVDYKEVLRTVHLHGGHRTESFRFAEPVEVPVGAVAVVEAWPEEDPVEMEAFLEVLIE